MKNIMIFFKILRNVQVTPHLTLLIARPVLATEELLSVTETTFPILQSGIVLRVPQEQECLPLQCLNNIAERTQQDGLMVNIPKRKKEWCPERFASTGAATLADGQYMLAFVTVEHSTCIT